VRERVKRSPAEIGSCKAGRSRAASVDGTS
jgi:hypothetical protein